MGATPKYALAFPEATDPADVPTDLHELADAVESALIGTSQLVTPAQMESLVPSDGMESGCSSTPRTVQWELVYRAASASAYKWEFVGGPPLYNGVDTQESTASVAFVALATPGPSPTVPRAGDYMVSVGSRQQAGANTVSFHSCDVRAVPVTDIDAASSHGNATGERRHKNKSEEWRPSECSDRQQYRCSQAVTSVFLYRWLTVQPIRLG
jgi:hypothetical protein